MGAVYLACDPLEEDFKVALKVLNPGQAQNSTAKERFRNEITASYKITHPNVVKAYEYFDAADVQAYAMEFVDGGDLLQRMNAGVPSVAETLDILRQTADALGAIHAAGIIHRDLKPENILLTRTGAVKITDFGVARLKDARTLTSAGSMVGTPKYLAPEYIEIGECDTRGDIFALGVIAYELLSGEAPFGNETNPAKMLERLQRPPARLSTQVKDLPAGLEAIVMEAMETKVSKRYQTARLLVEDIEAVQRGEMPKHAKVEAEHAATRPKPRSLFDLDPQEMLERGATTSAMEAGPDLKSNDPASSTAKPVVALKSKAFINEGAQGNEPAHSAALLGKLAKQVEAEEPEELAQHNQARRWMLRIGAAAMVGAVVLSAGVAFRNYKPNLEQLPEGAYTGQAFGVFGEGTLTPLGILRSRNETVVVLGKPGCAPAKLSGARTEFACGDLTFKISVEATTSGSAVGTITESSWQSVGTWSVSRR